MIMDIRTEGPSLFERAGGFARISSVVMDFYDRVLDSDLLAPWFENTDMRVLVDHQTKFVASLMGGPASYTDETLRRVHARLGITRAAFDEMKELLAQAFDAHRLAPEDRDAVLKEVERCAPLIVTA